MLLCVMKQLFVPYFFDEVL